MAGNVGYAHWFGWDGAGDSLWSQSIRPILDPREMAGDAGRVYRPAARFGREELIHRSDCGDRSGGRQPHHMG